MRVVTLTLESAGVDPVTAIVWLINRPSPVVQVVCIALPLSTVSGEQSSRATTVYPEDCVGPVVVETYSLLVSYTLTVRYVLPGSRSTPP